MCVRVGSRPLALPGCIPYASKGILPVMTFTIQRGTNISHGLSQSKRRSGERRAWFTQQDVRLLAERGFDHLRIPVDEEQLWDADGRPESEAFDLFDAALNWAEAAGMRAIVDLHILRSH